MGLRKTGVIKLLIIVPNALGVILGLVMLGISAYTLAPLGIDTYPLTGKFEKELRFSAIGFLFAGIFLSVVSFLAVYATIKNNRTMLMIYAILISIMLTVELATVIGLLVMENQKKVQLQSAWIDEMNEHKRSKYELKLKNSSYNAFDKVQSHLKCCGITSPDEWKNNTIEGIKNRTSMNLPPSCCKQKGCDRECKEGGCSKTLYYEEPCLDKIWRPVTAFKSLSFSVVAVHVFMIPGAIFLQMAIRAGKTDEVF